jgi:hypothetical protein
MNIRPFYRLTRRIILGCLAASAPLAQTSHARLDETLAQCEGRYGKVITRISGRAQDPAQLTHLFQTEISDSQNNRIPVRIRIEFNKEGRAWYIRYTGAYPAAAIPTFLQFNAGDGVFGESESFNDRLFYRTNAAAPYQAAQFNAGPQRVLEIYTYACVQDQKVLRKAQVQAIQADPNWEAFAAPGGTSTPASAPKSATPGGPNAPTLKFNGL